VLIERNRGDKGERTGGGALAVLVIYSLEILLAFTPWRTCNFHIFAKLLAPYCCWHGNMTRVMMSKPYELMTDLKLFGKLSHFKFPLRERGHVAASFKSRGKNLLFSS
jgi:hypothetical protein